MAKKTLIALVVLGLWISVSAWSTTVIKMNLGQLTKYADVIMEGRVLGMSKSMMDSSGLIRTPINLAVDEYSYARYPAQLQKLQFPLIQLGGQYNERTLHVPGMPTFKKGERVYLFLRENKETGSFDVLGLSQGKFTIKTDPTTGKDYVVQNTANMNLLDTESGKIYKAKSKSLSQQEGDEAEEGQEQMPVSKKIYLDDFVKKVDAYLKVIERDATLPTKE